MLRSNVKLRWAIAAALLGAAGCEKKKEPAYRVVSLPVARGTGVIEPASCGEEVVREGGVGNLRIGTRVDSLRATCTIVRDKTAMGAEGMPARKLTALFSRDTVVAEIVDGRVWRMALFSPLLRTTDSLGVGTPLTRLLKLKSPHGLTGEGALFLVSPEHCGLSFRLSDAGPASHRGDWDRASLARLPQSTVVSEVLIVGCPSAQSSPRQEP